MTAELIPVDGPANVPSLRTLGTGANQAMPGNTVIGGGGGSINPGLEGQTFQTIGGNAEFFSPWPKLFMVMGC